MTPAPKKTTSQEPPPFAIPITEDEHRAYSQFVEILDAWAKGDDNASCAARG